MFFQNIENVLREVASGMSSVGGGVILVCLCSIWLWNYVFR